MEEERGSGSRHSLCPSPADGESKVPVGRGHCDRCQALTCHGFSPLPAPLRAAPSVILSQCLSSPKEESSRRGQRESPDFGPGAYWGLLFRRHTEICRPPGLEVPPELSLHPIVPSGGFILPAKSRTATFPVLLSSWFPSRRKACGELSFTQQLQLVNGG